MAVLAIPIAADSWPCGSTGRRGYRWWRQPLDRKGDPGSGPAWGRQLLPIRTVLSSAEEGGQAAARAGRKDLASVIAREQRQIATAGLVPVGLSRLPVSPGHSGPAARMPSCLTRAGRRPVVWPHEIPDSGISHRSAGSGPRSGTEAGDISPVFAALEHAAGDFTTLGKNPLLEGSSPPSDTNQPIPVRFPQNRHHLNTRQAAGPHGRPGPRPRRRLLSGRQP